MEAATVRTMEEVATVGTMAEVATAGTMVEAATAERGEAATEETKSATTAGSMGTWRGTARVVGGEGGRRRQGQVLLMRRVRPLQQGLSPG